MGNPIVERLRKSARRLVCHRAKEVDVPIIYSIRRASSSELSGPGFRELLGDATIEAARRSVEEKAQILVALGDLPEDEREARRAEVTEQVKRDIAAGMARTLLTEHGDREWLDTCDRVLRACVEAAGVALDPELEDGLLPKGTGPAQVCLPLNPEQQDQQGYRPLYMRPLRFVDDPAAGIRLEADHMPLSEMSPDDRRYLGVLVMSAVMGTEGVEPFPGEHRSRTPRGPDRDEVREVAARVRGADPWAASDRSDLRTGGPTVEGAPGGEPQGPAGGRGD